MWDVHVTTPEVPVTVALITSKQQRGGVQRGPSRPAQPRAPSPPWTPSPAALLLCQRHRGHSLKTSLHATDHTRTSRTFHCPRDAPDLFLPTVHLLDVSTQGHTTGDTGVSRSAEPSSPVLTVGALAVSAGRLPCLRLACGHLQHLGPVCAVPCAGAEPPPPPSPQKPRAGPTDQHGLLGFCQRAALSDSHPSSAALGRPRSLRVSRVRPRTL